VPGPGLGDRIAREGPPQNVASRFHSHDSTTPVHREWNRPSKIWHGLRIRRDEDLPAVGLRASEVAGVILTPAW
jgi:hypothetical protein